MGFTLVLTRVDGSTYSLSDSGVVDSEHVCNYEVFSDPLFFSAAIVPDDDTGDINGLRLLSGAGVTDIGNVVGTGAVIESFTQTSYLIGFYGYHDGTRIT